MNRYGRNTSLTSLLLFAVSSRYSPVVPKRRWGTCWTSWFND